MNSEDFKRYNIIENILQKVNSKYIALPDDEKKRNNKLLQIIQRFIQKLCDKNVLFNNLYQKIFYGGSYYDGLKVGKPNEYDLDCVLCLPKIVEATVEESDKPGYVHIVLKNFDALKKNDIEAAKYPNLDKLLDANRLCTKKIKSWIESLMETALYGSKKMDITIDDTTCTVDSKVVKNGPALTIKLEGIHNGKNFEVSIDLVPCFIFFDKEWPKEGYRANQTNKNTFLVVPKSPTEDDTHYWRLSFQEQERELIHDNAIMKPAIRLIKKIRDRDTHKIASYYIKTIFLWELQKCDGNLRSQSLSFVFVTMLRKYSEYLEKKCIPYYWNQDYNLIEDLTEVNISCIANRIKNIADSIERLCNDTCNRNVYDIIEYFLKANEYDLETFKQDVPLPKKFLKRLKSVNAPSQGSELPLEDSAALSRRIIASCSSPALETVNEPLTRPEPEPSQNVSELQKLFLKLASQQERILEFLEELNEKFEEKKQEDAKQSDEMMKMIKAVDEKVNRLLTDKSTTNEELLDVFLESGDRLKKTLDFTKDF